MALTKCKECNHTISQSAKSCPSCGAKQEQTTTFTKIVASLFIFMFVVAIFSDKNNNENHENIKEPQKKIEKVEKIEFTESDFYWDKKTSPYKKIIITGVNKVIKENERCKKADPGSAGVSSSKGNKSNPVFYVMCSNDDGVFNVFFSKSDVEKNKLLAAAKHIDRGEAVQICASYAKSKVAHPSTFDFSYFLGLAVKPHPDGDTTVYSSFTAKNKFNLELKYDIRCLLNTNGLIEAHITEAT